MDQYKIRIREGQDRALLKAALEVNKDGPFRAADLKKLTADSGRPYRKQGVPKSLTRELLADVKWVTISEDADGFWYAWNGTPGQ